MCFLNIAYQAISLHVFNCFTSSQLFLFRISICLKMVSTLSRRLLWIISTVPYLFLFLELKTSHNVLSTLLHFMIKTFASRITVRLDTYIFQKWGLEVLCVEVFCVKVEYLSLKWITFIEE